VLQIEWLCFIFSFTRLQRRRVKRWPLRIFRLTVCLALVLSLNFLLPRLMPGDPISMLLGPDAIYLSQKDYAALIAEYGLDRSLWEQYLDYGRHMLCGNLGYSYHLHRPVGDLMRERLKVSLSLLVPALIISTLVSALLGTIAGWRRGTMTDRCATFTAVVLFATPPFMTAMVLLDMFSYHLSWFPLSGFIPESANRLPLMDALLVSLRCLALPVGVLALISVGAKYMVMRNAVSAALREGYVLYAKARGVPPWRIAFIHVFRNACLPLLHLVALHMGFMVSGAILVEIVFSINGMGLLIFDAALSRDYPVLQGVFLMLTLTVMGLNLLVDMAAGLVDPRIRHGMDV
jgi:peptide/nickel transport system permease protein